MKKIWPHLRHGLIKSPQLDFCKTPDGLLSDTRPWPYNRGNTVDQKAALLVCWCPFWSGDLVIGQEVSKLALGT